MRGNYDGVDDYFEYIYVMGQRHYEQKSHLGDVVSTLSDRRVPVDMYNYTTGTTHKASTVLNTCGTTIPVYLYVGTGGTKTTASGTDDVADAWLAEVESYSDYYPFGQQMPGRNANTTSYRMGYQGQEMDNEIKGTGNSLNYEYRMHDPRLGRFFAVDPLTPKYPYYSPYAFCGNKVIRYVELEGLEEKDPDKWVDLSYYLSVEKYDYNDYPWWWYPVIGVDNLGIGFWNRLVGTADYALNPHVLVRDLSGFYADARDYFSNVTWDQFKADLKASVTDPAVYENTVAFFIGYKACFKAKAEPKLTATKTVAKTPETTANVTNAEPNKRSSSPRPVKVSKGISSSKNLLKTITNVSRDFVYDPTTGEFAIAPKDYQLGHTGLTRYIRGNDDIVVGGRIRYNANGTIEFTEWSGHYGLNWTAEIKKKLENYLEQKTGLKSEGSGELYYKDGTK